MARDGSAVDDDLGERSRSALVELGTTLEELVGVELPALCHESFDVALERARDLLEQKITNSSAELDDVARASLTLLRVDALQRVRAASDEIVGAVDFSTLHRLSEKLAELDVEELLGPGAARVCESMGFRRSLFSFVSRSLWLPQTVFIDTGPDPDPEADELRDFVTGAEWKLDMAPLESEVVRRRSPKLVEAAQRSRLTFKPLMEKSRSDSYVVAPVWVGRRVIGLLHADRWGRSVHGEDLGRIEVYAHCLGVSIERAMLRRRIQTLARETASSLTSAATDLLDLDGDITALTDATATWNTEWWPDAAADIASRGRTDSPVEALSPREYDVMEQLTHGFTNAQIAARLSVGEGTVKSHVKNILRKLNVSSRAAAVAAVRAQEPSQGGRRPRP